MRHEKSIHGDSRSSGFVRATAVLVGGTAGAHLITAAAMPVLSRLFAPADFGTLAVFSGIVATIAVAACLRFDIAIALPESDNDAFNLLVLSGVCAVVVSLATAAMVPVGSAWIAQLVGNSSLSYLMWLVPVGIFSAGAYSALQNWNIRHRNFGLIARLRVGQSLASSSTQIGTGLIGIGALGLLAGYIVNTASAVVLLAARLLPAARASTCGLSLQRMRYLAKKYRRFPAYSTWEALANSAAIQVPIIFVAALAETAEAGFLMLAMYVMQAPMSLIGAAVGQVYVSQAPRAEREGRLAHFTVEVLEKLIKCGTGPIFAIGIISPAVFALVFGSEWARAGLLVAWMTPWFSLQFLAAPVSMALHVTGSQRSAMVLQIVALTTRIAAVWLASLWWSGAIGEAYALSGFVVYLLHLIVVLVTVEVSLEQCGRLLTTALRWSWPWLLGAALATSAVVLAS